QTGRYRPRYADHDLAFLFIVGEHEVAMVRFAISKATAAGAAGAAFAGTRQRMAMPSKRVQDRHTGCDLKRRSPFREPELERFVVGMGRGGADEILEVHRRVRPVAGHVAHRVHQTTW